MMLVTVNLKQFFGFTARRTANAADVTPLAVTQEDFLVQKIFSVI